MKSLGATRLAARCKRPYRAFMRSPLGRGWQRGTEIELGQQALSFASLGFLTLVPLLIIVSSADQESGRGFAQWLADGIGVSTASRKAVEELFVRPGKALHTTTAFGIAALAVFGLPFGTAVQTGYEKVWQLPSARWHTKWRHAAWLSVLTGYIFVAGARLLQASVLGALGGVVAGALFFWWSQRLLLVGRIRWRALLPGAAATVIGLLGLRVFSQLVFSPLIASNTVAYGPVGAVLVIESWLVGVGVVVFGGALAGRLIHEEISRLTHRRERKREEEG